MRTESWWPSEKFVDGVNGDVAHPEYLKLSVDTRKILAILDGMAEDIRELRLDVSLLKQRKK